MNIRILACRSPRFFVVCAIGVLGAALSVPVMARAASDNANPGKTALDAVEQALKAPGDTQTTGAEAKRAALAKIVSVEQDATLLLFRTINGFDVRGTELVLLRENLRSALKSYLTYLGALSGELMQDGLPLARIDEMVVEFQGRRASWYEPEVKKAIEFVAFFKGQYALDMAEARFLKVSEALKAFGSTKIAGILQSFLNAAAEELVAARQLQDKAAGILIAYLPRREGGMEGGESPARIDTGKSGQNNGEGFEVATLVQRSLTHVREAYSRFFDMNAALKDWNRKAQAQQ